MTGKHIFISGLAGIAVVVLCILCAMPANAQVEFSKDASWETMSNRYVVVELGTRGWAKLSSESDQEFIAGRWSLQTAEGDPEVAGDNNMAMISQGDVCPLGNWGYFKARIADKNYLIGDTNTGGWTRAPKAFPTPPSGFGAGRAGGFVDAEWTIKDGANTLAAVQIRLSIVRDQARIELTIKNVSSAAQNIGAAVHGDFAVGDNDRIGYSFVPGIGYWRQTASVLKTMGVLLTGNQVPDSFECMDSVDNPVLVARNTLKLQDCTPPDCVVIGEWSTLSPVDQWPPNYKPDVLTPLDDIDWVVAWNPAAVNRGASRKIVTYYGVGAATTSWTYRVGRKMEQDSVALAVQGPRSLRYDSTTTNQNDLTPNPFEIKAYVYNLATDSGPYTLGDVSVSLYLPSGLSLTAGQTSRKSVGRVPVNVEALPVTWTVEPTGEYSGELEYFVTARDVSGWQQVVSRKITVPATKKGVFRSGYQLMHVPFTFNNMTVEHALKLRPGSFGALYYDPLTNRYLPVTQLQPGQAFWMYVTGVARGRVTPFVLADDAAIVGEESGMQLREQYVPLKRGWNLIGNPFVYPMYWGQVLVANTSDPIINTVKLDQAVANGWLSKTVYSWIPESGTYNHFSDGSQLLLPWRGYWVFVKIPVTLVFRPPVPMGSSVSALSGGY